MQQQHTQFVKPLFSKENLFGNHVLIGNWFEERFDSAIDRKAIAPGIYGESQCLQQNSLYKNDFQYTSTVSKAGKEEYAEFIKWKQQSFSNRLKNEKANLKLWDGDGFASNMTTIQDIMYRIKPREKATERIEKPLTHSRLKDDDYMSSYGNSTKTGLLQWLECERKRVDDSPLDVTHYKNHYKPLKLIEKRVLHKGTRRKTKI